MEHILKVIDNQRQTQRVSASFSDRKIFILDIYKSVKSGKQSLCSIIAFNCAIGTYHIIVTLVITPM